MAHGAPIMAGNGPAETYRTGRVVRLASTAAMGGFLFGFDSAVINGANTAIANEFGLSSGLMALVVSIALIGSAVGAWFAGQLADAFGRRRVMLIAAVLFAVSAIGTAFPPNVEVLMIWRLIGGAGIGVASVVAPMYIAEISPAQLRGRMGSLQQLAIVLGILATGVTNYLIVSWAGSSEAEWLLGIEAWRWMFLIMLIPATVYFLMALRIPESPRFLVERGKLDEARAVLESVFTTDQSSKVEEIRLSMLGSNKSSVSDLRGSRFGLMPIVWIGILLSAFQQFVGINAVFYYSNLIWESVGFTQDQAFLTSMITNAVNVGTTLIAIALIDRVGRKRLLLTGSAGMALTLAALTVIFGTAPQVANGAGGMEPSLTGAASTIAVITFNAYVFFFGMSWGPVVWVLLGEMFPNRIRAAALALAASAQWIANFIVSTAFPPIAAQSLTIAYGIFTAFALASIFFVKMKVPETTGKSLEQISQEEKEPAHA
ncbi:MAG: sugar porter family MFS transporter [Actinomycetota bacterium]|nr:sugar porter family MFS transporter [Actinomycetota bacterium]